MDSFERRVSKKTTKYLVNGREYDSLEEVPPEYRSIFEDKDNDGVPDIAQSGGGTFETHVSTNTFEMTTTDGITTYTVGDQQYHSLEEMPPEYRAMFEDQNGDGIPDIVENLTTSPSLQGAFGRSKNGGFEAGVRGRTPGVVVWIALVALAAILAIWLGGAL